MLLAVRHPAVCNEIFWKPDLRFFLTASKNTLYCLEIAKSKACIVMKRRSWPDWWDWEIEFTSHLLKRMEDRDFNEVDLREMLHRSKTYKKDIVEGRWIIVTQHKRHPWEIIVEPDFIDELLIVITAYPVWGIK